MSDPKPVPGPFRLIRTGTPRIFTIQYRKINRATLALDVELSLEKIERWRMTVENALNSYVFVDDASDPHAAAAVLGFIPRAPE